MTQAITSTFGFSGLFQKAIIQSGAPLSQWGTLKHNAGGQARRFAAKFNCPIDDSLKMVKCLKQLDAKRLVYDGHIEAIVIKTINSDIL